MSRSLLSIGVAALAGVVVLLAGCGGGGSSSKPAYCAQRPALQSSITALNNLSTHSTVSEFESALQKSESDAKAMVDAAKSDFPRQSSALKSSLKSANAAFKTYQAAPTEANVNALGLAVFNLLLSVHSLSSAVHSKCG